MLDARSFDDSIAGGLLPLADICLGFNEAEPTPIVFALAEFFKKRELSVGLNDPIRGCFLPSTYVGHSSTFGLTVGLHRRLYLMEDGQPDASGFKLVKLMLGELYEKLTSHLL